MLKKLLILSLILLPFYEVFLYFFLPGRSFPDFQDMRITKDFVALAFAIGIGSTVLIKSGFKPLKNVWIPAFLLFIVWNIFKAPQVIIPINNADIGGMWNFKPAYQMFVYFFLFIGISSVEWDKDKIFETIAWCSTGMAIYMIFQKYGMDQIFLTYPDQINGVIINGSTKNPQMGGLLGHVTLSAPFVVMGIPFAVYCQSVFRTAILAICVALSGSSFAMVGMIVVFLCLFNKWEMWALCLVGAAAFVYLNKDFLNGNGRFEVWKQVIDDFRNGRIFLTGAGIGAFKYLFAAKRGSLWFHAHNEWLQLLWSCGLIGFGLVAMIIEDIFYNNQNKTIAVALIGIIVMSFGTFLLQLAVYQYYVVVLLGLTYSTVTNREVSHG